MRRVCWADGAGSFDGFQLRAVTSNRKVTTDIIFLVHSSFVITIRLQYCLQYYYINRTIILFHFLLSPSAEETKWRSKVVRCEIGSWLRTDIRLTNAARRSNPMSISSIVSTIVPSCAKTTAWTWDAASFLSSSFRSCH